MRFLFLAAFLAISVSACATKYQPDDGIGGYSDQLTGVNTATILFRGNAITLPTATKSFALKRAAELTLLQGYDYFLVENNNEYQQELATGPMVNCFSSNGSTQCYSTGGYTHKFPRTQLDIRMFRGAVPNETGYFDARFLAK